MAIFLGQDADGQAIELPLSTLLRHVLCLGASGSGKTVACKVLCEEFLLSGRPVIAVDPQGDIASMLLPGDPDQLSAQQLDPLQATQFHEKVEVVVWTPGSQSGVPLSLDPLKLDALTRLRKAEQIRLISSIAANLTALLGYIPDSNDGQSIAAYLDLVLQYQYTHQLHIQDLDHLTQFLDTLPEDLLRQTKRIIQESKRQDVHRKLAILGVGAKRLLFHMGHPLDIPTLLGLDRDEEATTRLSVIYLNSLHAQEEKDFFVNQLVQALYHWMLDNPSETAQALFYIDEIAPFLPPVRKPTCKESLRLLFKQARKYGICCLIASQNPGDIDYTALSQFSTWLLGRMMVQQDIKKVEKLIRSLHPDSVEQLIQQLPTLKPGSFQLLCPDLSQSVVTLSTRWLYTAHVTLDEERIEQILSDDVRQQFEEHSAPLVAVAQPAPHLQAYSAFLQEEDRAQPQPQVSNNERELLPPAQETPQMQEKDQANELDASDEFDTDDDDAQWLRDEADLTHSEEKDETSSTRDGTIATEVELRRKPKAFPTPFSTKEPPLDSTLALLQALRQVDSQESNTQHQTQVELSAELPQKKMRRSKNAELLHEYMEARPGAYTVRELIDEMAVSEQIVRRALKHLSQRQLVRSAKVGRSHYYWLERHAFEPAVGITRPLLTAPMKVHQERARIVAEKNSRHVLFNLFRLEAVSDPKPRHLLLWRCEIVVQQRKGLLRSQTETRLPLYLDAQSGMMLRLQEGQFTFLEQTPQRFDGWEDIAEFTSLHTQDPGSLDLDPTTLKGVKAPKGIKKHCQKTLGLNASRFRLMALPFWECELRSTGDKRRVVRIDGIFGRILQFPHMF